MQVGAWSTGLEGFLTYGNENYRGDQVSSPDLPFESVPAYRVKGPVGSNIRELRRYLRS